MQIFITFVSNGQKLTVDVEVGDSVESLREKICAEAAGRLPAHFDVGPETQQLLFGEKLLEDGHALDEYAIRKESELKLVLRPKQMPFDVEVGGRSFSVTLDTIMAAPKSRLSAMFEPMTQGGVPVYAQANATGDCNAGEDPRPLPRSDGVYVVDRDRDADVFERHILPFLRARQAKRLGRTVSCALPAAEEELVHLKSRPSSFS
eukprot:COSAG04_NODE_3796_length_2524_cov_1.189691_2_plen_205_part_00